MLQHAQDTDPSIYPSHDPSLHPSTPPHIPRQYTHNPIPQDIHNMHNQTHTPRPGSSQSRFHPPQPPHVEHHAPYANNEQGQKRVYNAPQNQYPNEGEAGPSRAAGSSGPSRDVFSSTQAQLDRLKSEVTQLDELVNRLKAHHITTESASSHIDVSFSAEQHSNAHHHEHLRAEEEERLAETQRKAQQEAEVEYRRKVFEYEASPATQTDLLRLIREMDSLVWMRRPSPSKSNTECMDAQNSRLGYGPRSDDVIFTKGNLDHLARRMRAWENVVRHKEREDDERYNIVS